MLFNSINFAIFLPIVFILYWFVFKDNLKFQNVLLLVSSYFFYSCWDWRFLFLLVFSTVLDYYTGIKMCDAQNQNSKRFWLWLSISINVGFLGVFKYYNFFAESFAEAISNFGLHVDPVTLDVILPVGISFYTFHGLSYVIDIYKNRIKAEKNFIDYSVFVSFFPLLVAGPIERATHLLPQIQRKRTFEYPKAVDGLRQILWGLFKKVVIADNCAEYVSMAFTNPSEHTGSTLVLGAVFFALQIYCDFSGYSDIAIGTSRLFGFELLRNFAFPYFSRDIAEFWRRWHISLSTWFRDYLYVPLGGSKGGTWLRVRNTFIIFIVSGFWHGANWTFIAWGILNAIYFLPLLLTNNNRTHLDMVASGKILPSMRELILMSCTFCLTTFAWIFFRADSVSLAVDYIGTIFSDSLFSLPSTVSLSTVFFIFCFLIIEWVGREKQFAIANVDSIPKWARYSFYHFLILAIFVFAGGSKQFIYFQF